MSKISNNTNHLSLNYSNLVFIRTHSSRGHRGNCVPPRIPIRYDMLRGFFSYVLFVAKPKWLLQNKTCIAKSLLRIAVGKIADVVKWRYVYVLSQECIASQLRIIDNALTNVALAEINVALHAVDETEPTNVRQRRTFAATCNEASYDWLCHLSHNRHVNPLWLSVTQIPTQTHGFDARTANRPFLVFDFRALWRQSARKSKTGQPGRESLSHCPHFGTSGKNGLSARLHNATVSAVVGTIGRAKSRGYSCDMWRHSKCTSDLGQVVVV